jgi:hypothetical protein
MSELNNQANAAGEAAVADSEGKLEDLLRQLHGQIQTSGWLEVNTANKLEEENPELIKAWKDAIEEKKD